MSLHWNGPSRAVALSLLAFVAAGCGAIRFDPDSEPQLPVPRPAPTAAAAVGGSWNGIWEIDGQRIEGTLTLRQTGSDLDATFASAALGSDAVGTGMVGEGDSVRLTLNYNVACPGTAELTGELRQQGALLGGSLVASDCTGRATGTFAFTRR